MTDIITLWDKIVSIFSTYSVLSDTLDLLLLTFLFYSIIKMIRDSRAITFAKGIVVFIIIYGIVLLLNMQSSAYLFKTVFDNILLILIVIFAPEIRKLLESMGTTTKAFSSIRGLLTRTSSNQKALLYNEKVATMTNEICRAAADMSDAKVGAIMVFEKETPLGEIIETGTVVDAEVTSELIGNIFFPKSPLHDGATIVRDCKLYAAGCILPLTSKSNLSSSLGTRHRAAIGMSEQSDALVLVVSEETGSLSIARNGKLNRDVPVGEIREQLLNFLTIPVGGDKHE